MVFSPDLPGVEVAITVQGNDLKEYDDDEEPTEIASEDEEVVHVTKYVEATSEQVFAIRIKVTRDFDFAANALKFFISMDGSQVASHTVVKLVSRMRTYEHVSEGCRGGDGRLRKYQFAVLETGKFASCEYCMPLAEQRNSERRPPAQERKTRPQGPGNDRRPGRAEGEIF